MPLYPAALHRPLTVDKTRRPLTVVNRVNLHVAVAESATLHHVFNRRNAADSHFYVRRDGTVEQYVDTSMRANADLEGNDATISVETQGGVTTPDTELWTPQQCSAIARLYAWVVAEHGVALRLARSSKIGEESRGLSWHRLGVDGAFPPLPDVRAGRLQRGGGMRYSTARGKLCPGGAKIGQIPEILAAALTLLDGLSHTDEAPGAGTSTSTSPATAPPPAGALAVDGTLGPATIRRWQTVMGTPVDGRISRRSQLVMAVQRTLLARGRSIGSAGLDGELGPATIRALQAELGTPVDGVISRASQMVMALQRRLNEGVF